MRPNSQLASAIPGHAQQDFSGKKNIYSSGAIPSWKLTYPPKKGPFEDDFPFPKVGYVNSLEGISFKE